MKGVKIRNLYLLSGLTLEVLSMSFSDKNHERTNLSHKRLGHIRVNMLKAMIENLTYPAEYSASTPCLLTTRDNFSKIGSLTQPSKYDSNHQNLNFRSNTYFTKNLMTYHIVMLSNPLPLIIITTSGLHHNALRSSSSDLNLNWQLASSGP